MTEPSANGSASLPEALETSSALAGAFVVLGVTGSIAAYKAVEICRRLVEAGAHVAPILTRSATRFIGTATFSALASEPAKIELFGDPDPIPHTRLGQAADLVIVAPASASSLARYATGMATDLLSATLTCTTAPVMCCPAMHTEMWENQAIQENVATLRRRGVVIVEPESGRLAGGDVGSGRLADPGVIVSRAGDLLTRRGELAGVSVLVTAGGTREPIDPVRYLSNRSSGRQGYAIAVAAWRRGATVTLVSTVERSIGSDIEVIAVETAAELRDAVLSRSSQADVVVMTAAVADFRPDVVRSEKLKSRDGVPELHFEKTPDILAELSAVRHTGQVIVGFAAETTAALENAAAKLKNKQLDLIVVNDVSRPGVGFGHETNAVTIIDRTGGHVDVPLALKSEVAEAVLDAVRKQRTARPT